MKKIVSNILVVSTQLIVGGLFLFMLFSGHTEDGRVVVVDNNNLNKMADAVSELFEVDHAAAVVVDTTKEETLVSAEEKAKEEEAQRIAAEEEAKRLAEEEAARQEAERIAQEEAKRKAEEAARSIVASSSQSVQMLQEYAHDLVINTYGWSEDDYVALVNLWNRESGWDVNCYNTSSGATGIPQALPGNKMASEGDDWATNGETQIRWGLKYIQGRYGTPSGAWAHFLSVNWY